MSTILRTAGVIIISKMKRIWERLGAYVSLQSLLVGAIHVYFAKHFILKLNPSSQHRSSSLKIRLGILVSSLSYVCSAFQNTILESKTF